MTQQMKHKKTSLETSYDGEDEDTQQPKIYAKNSMDRFGDDLCALLLSYLSFKNRFRYECVSKQFQRTVFGSPVDITLNYGFIQILLINEKTIDTQLLATIARKCVIIDTIDCRGISAIYKEHIPEVLNTFRDNCRHLREIYCNGWDGQWMPSLWPLVTRIRHNRSEDSEALTHCHRLSQLSINSFNIIFDSIDGKLLAKNLSKFSIYSYKDDDNHRWPAFVANNQCLQSLAVHYRDFSVAENMRQMCGQLSQLTQLRELTLGLVYRVLDGQMPAPVNQCLRTIGVNCKQLQRLSLLLHRYSAAEPVLTISLDLLRFYSRLKRLHLTLFAATDDQMLERLRHCKRLTHLKLILREMTPNVVKD
ncbi:unnamed protein product, partial [Medioppia subpectinata]